MLKVTNVSNDWCHINCYCRRRTLFLPKEVPAGVFIAAFGAPFFIYLLLTVKSYNDIIKTK